MAEISRTNTFPVFKVTRQAPELIPPAERTPYEFKELSDVDNQDGLRDQVPVIIFYNRRPNDNSGVSFDDPAKVIKEAIAKALVPYYPLAGRLRERPGRKLVVECTGEGIVFVEADADVTIEEFGEPLHPPFPCIDELLFDVPGSSGILDSPVVLIQVTRLRCGGFTLAIRMNHVMVDAIGKIQFLNAIAELARGARFPLIQPVWERHLLMARDPPRVTYPHHEYDHIQDNESSIIISDDMVRKAFFFGPNELNILRSFVPSHLKSSSRFDIITAFLWRCRTIALAQDPDEEVRVRFVVNVRSILDLDIPTGYYGNAIAFLVARTTSGELSSNSLGYAVELMKKTKANATTEYIRSLVDHVVIKGRPRCAVARTFLVSDVSRVGFNDIDFGWGLPSYSGPLTDGLGVRPGLSCYYIAYKNSKGESGIVTPICLPRLAMERFVRELEGFLSDAPEHPITTFKSRTINSSL